MAALDTSVLVRFLVEDDPAQTAAVRRLFEACAARNEQLFVPKAAVLEFEWALRKVYEVSMADFVVGLSQLLSATELVFEDEAAIEESLDLYQTAKAGFADCLHLTAARRAGREPLWIFDSKAARLPGARALTAAGLAHLQGAAAR